MAKKRKGIGINKVEWLLMVPGLHKQLRKSIDNGILDVEQALLGVAYFTNRMKRAAHRDYKPIFGSLTDTLTSVAVLTKEDEMAKFELGITVGEITAMLPTVLAEAWEHYEDDKKITVDEALLIVGVILNEMSQAADDDDVKNLFASVQATVEAIGPFVVEEEAPVEPPVE